MPEEAISFEIIRKIQRAEQRNPKLTELPGNFYENIIEYLERKKNIAEKKRDRKITLEIRNTERLIEDIFNRRERKILNQALISVRTGIPPENLTDKEKIFFDQVMNLLKQRREEVLNRLFKKTKKEVELLLFKEDVPEFIGIDLKKYGPFKKGDIAKLPEKNAKLLIKAEKAETLKVEV